MENTNILKLFEEIENIENNEGIEALTNEKICELCEKYDISMTELKNLVVEILSAGEITSFSDNEKTMENVAGGKMCLKKGTATLLAALSTASPFADTFAAKPFQKATGNLGTNIVSFKKGKKQAKTLKNIAIKYTQKKFSTTPKKAKHAVLAAEAIAATSLVATTCLIYNKFSSKNYVPFDILSEHIERREFELSKSSGEVAYIIIKINLGEEGQSLYSKFDVRQYGASNRSVALTAEAPQCNGYSTLTITVDEQEAQQIFGINKLKNGVVINPRWSNELTSTLRQLISSAVNSEEQPHQDKFGEGEGHAVQSEPISDSDDHDEKDEIEPSGNLIKIPSISETDELLEKVKERKNVIIVYRHPRSDDCYIFFPDDEDGIASEALDNFTKSRHDEENFRVNVLSSRYGYSHIAMNKYAYNLFLTEFKKQENITVLELENIEGDVERLMCGSSYESGRKKFTKEVFSFRERQRIESSGDNEEQEGFTAEVLRKAPNKVIKIKSLSKKEDLLIIVKENHNVIIVHRKENQKGSEPIGYDIFPICEEERSTVRRALSFEDNLFTTDDYSGFLNKLKTQKDITILELENIKGEVEYLLKPRHYGYLRREDFAASVVSAKKEETQPPSTTGGSSSSSSWSELWSRLFS